MRAAPLTTHEEVLCASAIASRVARRGERTVLRARARERRGRRRALRGGHRCPHTGGTATAWSCSACRIFTSPCSRKEAASRPTRALRGRPRTSGFGGIASRATGEEEEQEERPLRRQEEGRHTSLYSTAGARLRCFGVGKTKA